MKNAYEREIMHWNHIYQDYEPLDLRNISLSVEPLFDDALRLFAEKTSAILDFGCGTGDISFQYLQYAPDHKVLGIDKATEGIKFARKTAFLSGYHDAVFKTGGIALLDTIRDRKFDGIILSNVLDVMPKKVSLETIDKLKRLLKSGGFWFVKLNPFYTKDELQDFGYESKGANIYEEDHIMRLRQDTTHYWKNRFSNLGEILIYLEFEYPWQEGLNRLFIVKSK